MQVADCQAVMQEWGVDAASWALVGSQDVCMPEDFQPGEHWSGWNPKGGAFWTLNHMLKLELHPIGGGKEPHRILNGSSITRLVLATLEDGLKE